MGQVTDVVQRQFGLKPKNITVSYKKPYLEWFDQVLLPPRYRHPHFVKFTGMGSVSTMEHVNQYLAQLGKIADEPTFKVRFFPLSLSGPVFSWFASLPHYSIEGWEDLETKFHHYFDSRIMEKGIIDLVDVRQRNNESPLHYL